MSYRSFLRGVFLPVVLLATIGAQCNMVPSVSSLGGGCGLAGTPVLSVLSAGPGIVLNLTSPHPNAMSKIVVSLPGAPFVIDGCNVFLNPAFISLIIEFSTDAQGNASFFFDVPDLAGLEGMTFIIQAVEWFAGGPIGAGDSTSNALSVTLGCVGGAVGCTPGYWKQEHHFGSWPAAYAPNQLFSSVFEDAFPGMTLVEVLSNGGGGIEALGRHAVAALLNSEASGASFGLAGAQVISMFDALFPEHGLGYESLKNLFAGMNEQGCNYN